MIDSDLITYLEMALLAMERNPRTLAEHLDLSDEELARLESELRVFMNDDEAPVSRRLVTPKELFEAGKSMWYSVTDDDCRLRGGGPEMFGNHLKYKFFPTR